MASDKVQTIKLTFANGTTGTFIGRACVSYEELKEGQGNIEKAEIGVPEDPTDEVRRKLEEQEKKNK